MAKQIVWSRLAHNDRIKILEYWTKRTKSTRYSRKLNRLFNDAVELISRYPQMGKKTEMENIRVKVVRDYFLTYRETEKAIEVLTVWDTRQDPEKFEQVLV